MARMSTAVESVQHSAVYRTLSRRPTWELRNMVQALDSMGGFFNSAEDNERLAVAKQVLRERRKQSRQQR